MRLSHALPLALAASTSASSLISRQDSDPHEVTLADSDRLSTELFEFAESTTVPELESNCWPSDGELFSHADCKDLSESSIRIADHVAKMLDDIRDNYVKSIYREIAHRCDIFTEPKLQENAQKCAVKQCSNKEDQDKIIEFFKDAEKTSREGCLPLFDQFHNVISHGAIVRTSTSQGGERKVEPVVLPKDALKVLEKFGGKQGAAAGKALGMGTMVAGVAAVLFAVANAL